MSPPSRRTQYRVEPDGTTDLRAEVALPKGPSVAGRLLDVSASGAGMRFGGGELPSLAVGDEVDLVFSSSAFRSPLTVPARVQHREEDTDGEKPARRYGFRFLQPQHLETVLPPSVHELFNRRRMQRVAPDLYDPIKVELKDASGAACDARLHNVSMSGAGVSIRAEMERLFADATKVAASIQLPDAREPSEIDCRIRYRRLVGRRIHYGLEFDASTAEHERFQAQLTGYVMKRQMNLLRKSA